MLEFTIAFGAGLLSFLSPCVLPLIPGYISFISGQSLQDALNSKKINFFPLVLFCLGFSTVFISLGASASFVGRVFLQNSEFFRILAGIVIIIFSLQLIGVINISYLNCCFLSATSSFAFNNWNLIASAPVFAATSINCFAESKPFIVGPASNVI